MTVSSAIDVSAVARAVGTKVDFKNLRAGAIVNLPQRVMVIGQGSSASSYSNDKLQVTSALEVASTYGFGSPLHLAVQQLLPANGDGVGTIPVTVYPLQDATGAAAATGSIAPVGTATKAGQVEIFLNRIRSVFAVAVGDNPAAIVAKIVAAVSAQLDNPVTAVNNAGTSADFTSKWQGSSANGIIISIVEPGDLGVTFGITEMSGGLVNPSISGALAQVGNIWETRVVNCFESTDTTILDALQTFNEGRWLPLSGMPLTSFSGTTETDVNTAIAVPDARKTDRTNVQIPLPGSENLPLQIAARAVARVASRSQNSPAFDYATLTLTGLTPGSDAQQWDYLQRDQAVKGGSSTIEVVDGIAELSDTVTYYHPSGDPTPAYRYVVDINKVMQILFNVNVRYKQDDWNGAPLIPDDQDTVNPDAKQPKMATADTAAIIDNAAAAAILSDPATAKGTIVSVISSMNPKRLEQSFTVQISGNSNIISIDFNFGFFFGSAAA